MTNSWSIVRNKSENYDSEELLRVRPDLQVECQVDRRSCEGRQGLYKRQEMHRCR
jgi:hypothetical protein